MFSEKELLYKMPEQSVLNLATGGFTRRVLVLTYFEPDAPHNRDFLIKILAAAGLNLETDTLFAEIPAGKPVSLLPAIKEKHAEIILIFGLHMAQLGFSIDFPLYHIQSFYGTTILIADPLSVLEPDKLRKGKLWESLQQLFI